MSERLPTVGMIGLGIMGATMAGHLLAAGYPLRVFNRTPEKARALIARGAVGCGSPAEAARGCEVLCLNVTDTADVEEVLFGPMPETGGTPAPPSDDGATSPGEASGAAGALARGAVVIDFSTISPQGARRIAARLAERGVEFLDAPVTGGQVGAQNATLTILAGGRDEVFARVRPLLEKLGQKIVHVGPSGSGQALKACNQVLCAVNMIGVCEALRLAQASGLDLAKAIDALSEGAGGSWAWRVLGAKIAAGDLQPAFMIRLMQKDLRIVEQAARRAGLELPGTELARELFSRVEGMPGGGELGTQGMIRAYESCGGSDAEMGS